MDYYQAIINLGMFCQCQSITVVETMFSVAMAGSNLSFIIISLQVKKFIHSQIPWFRCVCAYMLEYNQGNDMYRLLSKM